MKRKKNTYPSSNIGHHLYMYIFIFYYIINSYIQTRTIKTNYTNYTQLARSFLSTADADAFVGVENGNEGGTNIVIELGAG